MFINNLKDLVGRDYTKDEKNKVLKYVRDYVLDEYSVIINDTIVKYPTHCNMLNRLACRVLFNKFKESERNAFGNMLFSLRQSTRYEIHKNAILLKVGICLYTIKWGEVCMKKNIN